LSGWGPTDAKASTTPTDGASIVGPSEAHSGQLRGTFGVHVARIAATFKLDVEDRLASIVPANAEADTADDDRLFRRLYL
jgi:hypothetical protein